MGGLLRPDKPVEVRKWADQTKRQLDSMYLNPTIHNSHKTIDVNKSFTSNGEQSPVLANHLSGFVPANVKSINFSARVQAILGTWATGMTNLGVRINYILDDGSPNGKHFSTAWKPFSGFTETGVAWTDTVPNEIRGKHARFEVQMKTTIAGTYNSSKNKPELHCFGFSATVKDLA